MDSVFTSSPNSTISTHSTSSHSDSISSLQSTSSPIGSITRCEGLDLLVKAVYYVAGSIVGVPFIQRKVIRRRRRRRSFELNQVWEIEIVKNEQDLEAKRGEESEEILVKEKKRERREMALPLKYQDSVLQPWKRQSRSQR